MGHPVVFNISLGGRLKFKRFKVTEIFQFLTESKKWEDASMLNFGTESFILKNFDSGSCSNHSMLWTRLKSLIQFQNTTGEYFTRIWVPTNRSLTIITNFFLDFQLNLYIFCQFFLIMSSSVQFCIWIDVFVIIFPKIWLAKNYRCWHSKWHK